MSNDLPPDDPRSKESVGLRLIAAREVLDANHQGKFAKTIGVQPNTYNQWEKGERMANLHAMMRMWDRTGFDLNYIYMGRTDTLPFDLANKIRAHMDKVASEPVEIHRDDIAAATAERVTRRPGTESEHDEDHEKA